MAYNEKEIETIFDSIIDNIENGMSLRSVLKMEGIPNKNTIYKWLEADETKKERYARATYERADVIFEEILKIADETINDTIETENGEKINAEFVARSKLRVDARKWVVSKMHPTKYGDRSTHVLEGGEKPIEINFED